MSSIFVDIPENYLLIIAAHGNLGSGELPGVMRVWAQRLCMEHGLGDKLRELQTQNIQELRGRIANTLGVEAMQEIDNSISNAIQKLNE